MRKAKKAESESLFNKKAIDSSLGLHSQLQPKQTLDDDVDEVSENDIPVDMCDTGAT